MDSAELAHRLRELARQAASHGDDVGPLEQLALLKRLRWAMSLAEGEALFDARLADHEWAEIGDALGMSPQGVGQRYRRHGRRDPRPLRNQRRRPR